MQTSTTEDDYLNGVAGTDAPDENSARELLLAGIDEFGLNLAKTRSEAIEGRQASGIEQEWQEDEEYYEGIDDANRGENPAWRSKPLGRGGMDTGADAKSKPSGSTVFPNITRPYVDAASARTSDMLLPTDDVSWSLAPTPIPELIPISQNRIPNRIYQQVLQQSGGDKVAAEQKIAGMVEQVKQQMAEAKQTSERAQSCIQDWHIECQYHSQVRTQIEDAAKVGAGVLKGPVPMLKKVAAYKNGQLIIQEEIKPVSVRIDYWNFYPDPACGNNIHNGSYIWERDDLTKRALEDLRDDPNYIKEQIEKCLSEGPHVACKIDAGRNDNGLKLRDNKNLFEIWYYHGACSKAEYMAAMRLTKGEEEFSTIKPSDYPETIYITLTMVNNHVIKIAQNPLDTGDFPYDVLNWQRRRDHWAGIGVARQVRTAQRIVTAAFRAMMDNAGRASGPMVLFDPSIIGSSDGVMSVEPWKFFQLLKTLDSKEALDNAFRFLKIDMMQAELANIIEMGLRLAEDATGLPMIMQGQTNSATPTTLGGMQMQNNNASTVLRRIARLYDDQVTEPHVRRYYNWLLMYGEDNAKGDFLINAMGSSALVERELQMQQVMQMGNIVVNPVFGIDPKKWAKELLKSQRLDITRFEYDDEEWQQIVQQLSQPQQTDNRLEVAQLRAEVDKLRIASNENIAAYREDRQDQRLKAQQDFELMMNQLEQDVIAYENSVAEGMNREDNKVKLADTVMKLKAQFQLSNQTMKPPTEPGGRAPNGQAFAR